jgi:hypothetical protein
LLGRIGVEGSNDLLMESRMWWKRWARSTASRKSAEDSRPLIDVVGPRRLLAPIEACRALLPDHFWLGDGCRVKDDPAFAPGAPWIACADLVIEDPGNLDDAYYRIQEELGHRVERHLYLVGLLSQARHGGVPVARSEISSYSWPAPYRGLLEVIDAGTPLEVVRLTDSYFPEYNWKFVRLDFHLPDGRAFRLETGTSYDDAAGFVFAWDDLPTQAVIVPAGHPFATDSTLVDTALARIAAAAEEGDPRGH